MAIRYRLGIPAAGAALLGVLTGCGVLSYELTSLFNSDFLTALGLGSAVASLPGDAPTLLVAVENRTSRWVAMTVAYRAGDDTPNSYTTTLAPGGKSAQLLDCPVAEMTLGGDVSNLSQSGARVYLTEPSGGDVDSLEGAPYIEVDAFGKLLIDEVNYNCGDSVTFTVQPSSDSRSGYQTFAYIRRARS